MICASITVNGSGFDILSLFLGALGILFVIISLSLNKRDNTEVDDRNDHQDLQKNKNIRRFLGVSIFVSYKTGKNIQGTTGARRSSRE